MADNIPIYPDIGCLTFPSTDEDTKKKLLQGSWLSNHAFSILSQRVYLICVVDATILPARKWLQQSSGYLQPTGYTFKGMVRGHLDCLWRSSEMGTSRSFFYNDVTKDCQCHDDIFSTAGMLAVPNARYFELQEISKIPCPADAAVPTEVFRSGDKLYTVRAFLDTGRYFDDAQAICVNNGGVLYKVNTLEKFHIALQLLKECSAYASHTYYWVNGKVNETTNKFETLDGELIPMTDDFWIPNEPNFWPGPPYTQFGVRMRAEYGFMLDDFPYNYTLQNYALCEIPQ